MEEVILLKIYEHVKSGYPAALAVITEEIGSSPRKGGSMMAVFHDGSIEGSVGGGKLEYTVINKALECMKDRTDSTFEYKLTETGLGMVCGGTVRGYIKVFLPKDRLLIVGAGHVGFHLHKIAKIVGFQTVIFDDREAYASKERFPDADEIIIGDFYQSLTQYEMSEKDTVVIVTSGHMHDKDALKAVIDKNVRYIGMIGSARKTRTVMHELMDEGISEDALRKVYAPMGLDIANGEPGEIAVSILSEILLIKNEGTLNHRKNVRKVWD